MKWIELNGAQPVKLVLHEYQSPNTSNTARKLLTASFKGSILPRWQAQTSMKLVRGLK
jgi:hypothetical protein